MLATCKVAFRLKHRAMMEYRESGVEVPCVWTLSMSIGKFPEGPLLHLARLRVNGPSISSQLGVLRTGLKPELIAAMCWNSVRLKCCNLGPAGQ
jgi:hypothetical protein